MTFIKKTVSTAFAATLVTSSIAAPAVFAAEAQQGINEIAVQTPDGVAVVSAEDYQTALFEESGALYELINDQKIVAVGQHENLADIESYQEELFNADGDLNEAFAKATKLTKEQYKDYSSVTANDKGEIEKDNYIESDDTGEVEVETVSAINETGVTVTFEALEEAQEGATIAVVDPNGNTVEVTPVNLEVGDESATFDFVTAYEELPLGVFKVQGQDFDTAAVAAVTNVNAATNVVELWNALQSEYFTGAVEANIEAYENALDGTQVTVAEINQIIADVNTAELDEEAEADIVKTVADAKNVLQLLNALKDPAFARVNADWITNSGYAQEVVVNGTTMLDLASANYLGETHEATIELIQDAIDAVNDTKVQAEIALAVADVDSAQVTKARNLVNAYIPADTEDVTTKAGYVKTLDIQDAIIAVNKANTNAKLTAALNTLVAKVDDEATIDSENIHSNLMGDYRALLEGKDLTTVEAINTEIDKVNVEFGSFETDESTVAASATARPTFTIKALQKDTKIKEDMPKVDRNKDITVTIDGVTKQYDVVSGENFHVSTKGEVELEAKNLAQSFDLSQVDNESVATIKFETEDGQAHEVKATVKVTAGEIANAETLATLDLSNVEGTYASGEDIEFTFTLKDAGDNTITSENGTYASTITIATDKYYQNISFVDGKATVKTPARTVVNNGDIQVEATTESGALNITATSAITIEAGEFSNLTVSTPATTGFKITATDGVNKITDLGTKVVNLKISEVDAEGKETPVDTSAITDYQGNLSATFESGDYTVNEAGLLEAGKSYKVTVTVNGVTTTKTIKVPGSGA